MFFMVVQPVAEKVLRFLRTRYAIVTITIIVVYSCVALLMN